MGICDSNVMGPASRVGHSHDLPNTRSPLSRSWWERVIFCCSESPNSRSPPDRPSLRQVRLAPARRFPPRHYRGLYRLAERRVSGPCPCSQIIRLRIETAPLPVTALLRLKPQARPVRSVGKARGAWPATTSCPAIASGTRRSGPG